MPFIPAITDINRLRPNVLMGLATGLLSLPELEKLLQDVVRWELQGIVGEGMLSQEEAASYQDDIVRRRMDALTTTSAHIPTHQKFRSRTLPLRRDIRDTHHPRPRARRTPPPWKSSTPASKDPWGLSLRLPATPAWPRTSPEERSTSPGSPMFRRGNQGGRLLQQALRPGPRLHPAPY